MLAEDSTTSLVLDMFPTDPAASVDSDGDGYPDGWNSGMGRSDSTLGLFIDAYPNDPDRWEEVGASSDEDDDDTDLSVMGVPVALILILIVIVIIIAFILR